MSIELRLEQGREDPPVHRAVVRHEGRHVLAVGQPCVPGIPYPLQLVGELRRGGGSAEMTRRELYHLVRRGLIRAPAPGMWTYQITEAGRTILDLEVESSDNG